MSRVKCWIVASLIVGNIVVAEENVQIGDSVIIGPTQNVCIALNDYGAPDGPTTGTSIQGKTGYKIKKMLSLEEIPSNVWDKTEKMYVSAYMYSSRFIKDEDERLFDVVVNGYTNSFSTDYGVGRSFGKMCWIDFSIPKEQFIHGMNSIVIGKSKNTTDLKNYIYIGAASSYNGNSSFKSTDGGKTWTRGFSNRKNATEFMVRIRMDLSGCNLPLNQDRSKIADYDVNPQVKNLGKRHVNDEKSCKLSDQKIILTNSEMKIVFATGKKLTLESFINKAVDIDLISQSPAAGQLFLLVINGKRYYARDLTLLKVIPLQQAAQTDSCGVKFIMEEPKHKVTVEFTVELTSDKDSQYNLVVNNNSAKTLSVNAAFPLLSGVRWSDDIEKDYYLFPYSGGVISPLAGKYETVYGDAAYIQLLTSYSPDIGAGIFMKCNDKSGGYKVLNLKKQVMPSLNIDEIFNTPKMLSKLPGRVEKSYYLHNPLPDVYGTSMAFSYLKRSLTPGGKWQLPSASIAMVVGDWHKSISSYRQWFRSWAHKRPSPSKLAGKVSCLGTWMKSCHNTEGYSAEYPEYYKGNIAEFYGWWEQKKITPEFIEENKKLAMKQANKEWKPWRQYEGYLFGNCGDYGSQGYNERWGGLPAFKKHLSDTKQQGITSTLYTEGILADVTTEVGRKHGSEWGVIKKDGTYLWNYNLWNMCVDTVGWGDYLAQTAQRLVRETGCDGIRFDQFGHAGWVCHSTNHVHTFALPGHNAWVQAETDICRRVREAMDKVDESSVLMTEYPGHDVMSQYIDGCATYDSDHYEDAYPYQPMFVSLFRFYFNECKLYELLFSHYRDTAIRDMLFNGLGRYDPYPEKINKIMHENSDAFDGDDAIPLIPTLARRVYVNRFKGEKKTIYTVLNRNKEIVDGELFEIILPVGQHVVDIDNGIEISTYRSERENAIIMRLIPEKLYCIGMLPENISFKWNDGNISVCLKHGINGRLSVIEVNSKKELFSVTLTEADNRIEFSPKVMQAIQQGQDIFVKLYEGDELIDIKAY